MEYLILLAIGLVLMIVVGVVRMISMSPEELVKDVYGPLNQSMKCPHCDAIGHVRTKTISQKKGVSGGKATAAILTSGVSLAATGLSRKETKTQAHCTKCNNTWNF